MREAADSAQSFRLDPTQDVPKADLSLQKMINIQQPRLVIGEPSRPSFPQFRGLLSGVVIVVEMKEDLLEKVGLQVLEA